MKRFKQFNSKIIIRREFIGIVLFSIFFDLHAQPEQFQNLPQYLFPDFSKSTLIMKVGKKLTVLLNYNIVTEKMVFFQKGQVFNMANPETVDTAIIDNRKFIPVAKAFYEVIMERPVSLFSEHKGDLVDQGKPAGYGGTSQVSSSTYISKLDGGTSVYNFKLTGDLIIKPYQVFWISINGDKHSFANERQLKKIFPEKEKEIKLYIKQNHLKFENPPDVKKLVQFCTGFIK